METAQSFFLVLLLATCFGGILSGIPVAFALGGGSVLVALAASIFGVVDLSVLSAIPSRIFGTAMYNEVLSAVPLFILMGVLLERSKIAEEMIENMSHISKGLPGGLGVAVMVVGILLAASTGIVGATVVALGLICMPTMLKQGYSAPHTAGSICAAGTLGQIVPPSIALVFLGDQISSAYLQAQRNSGNFSPETVSIGDLFAGALIPGLLLGLVFVIYQIIHGLLNPLTQQNKMKQTAISKMNLFRGLIAPFLLIFFVLGSILFGVATPTEAAGIGAFGAFLLAGHKFATGKNESPKFENLILLGICAGVLLPLTVYFANVLSTIACIFLIIAGCISLYKLLEHKILQSASHETVRIASIAFMILIGATIFALMFRNLGGEAWVLRAIEIIPGGVIGSIIAVSILIFLLGFILDFVEIIFIIIPIVAPIILQSDINPIWFAVLVAMNLQTSFLTPPFGFSLFYLKSVAPASIGTRDIYVGVIPFVCMQLFVLLLVFLFPEIATWLPQLLR